MTPTQFDTLLSLLRSLDAQNCTIIKLLNEMSRPTTRMHSSNLRLRADKLALQKQLKEVQAFLNIQ